MAKIPLFPLWQDLRSVLPPPIRTQTCVNLLMETRNYYMEAHIFNYDRLVVTFEDASLPQHRPDRHRMGWGTEPLIKRAVSVLAIKPKEKDWYSRPDLPEALQSMRAFFDRFGEVITYGMSMGGFAALTYADVIGAKRVVALAPQSTYRRVDGRRENRFPTIVDYNHTHPWGDAIEGCRTVSEIWLWYDAMERMDKWHATRFEGPNVHHLRTPFFAHAVPTMLKHVEALPMVLDLVVTGQIDREELYRRLRRRREFTLYQTFLRIKARRRPYLDARLRRILGDDDVEVEKAPTASDRKNDGNSSQTE